MKKKLKPAEYKSKTKPTWCAGCGNHSVLAAMTNAFSTLNIDLDNLVVASGIGCSSRIPYFIGSYGFHSVHGRALPLAIGIKSANPKIRVVVTGGDGDGFSIGGNHLLHTARKNPDMTYIVMDNAIYGLTKGQNSPTSSTDLHTKVNPYENLDDRINPILLALSNNTSFIARGFSGDIKPLTELIIKGMEHKGFSFIHIMSPCVQFNTHITYDYVRNKIKPIPENHDITDRVSCVKLALEKDPLYSGVFYQIQKKTLTKRLNEVRDVAMQFGGPEVEQKQRNLLDSMMEQFK